jgi:hypothetical protein
MQGGEVAVAQAVVVEEDNIPAAVVEMELVVVGQECLLEGQFAVVDTDSERLADLMREQPVGSDTEPTRIFVDVCSAAP